MHDDATLLAAFGLASFALVAALIPLVSDIGAGRTRAWQRGGSTQRRLRAVLVPVISVGVACVLFAADVRVHRINDGADLALTVAWLVAMAGAFRMLAQVDGAAPVVALGAAIAVTVPDIGYTATTSPLLVSTTETASSLAEDTATNALASETATAKG